MSEILNDEIDTKESGFSRRRVVKGVAWSVPVLVAAVGVPPASASPGPVVTQPPAPASGSFTSGTSAMPSTGAGSPHDRAQMVVPTALKLKDLNRVTGEVGVVVTISAPAPAPIISFSTVKVGTATLSITRPTTTQAEFAFTLPPGATTLDFDISGYSYTGKKQDVATYSVTTTITYVQGGKSIQMSPSPSSSISLPKAG